MLYDYHIVLAAIGGAIGLISFVPYFRDIIRGSTKPHLFSWLLWTLLVGITFFIQFTEGGGAGAWVTGIEAACCGSVTVLAYLRGERDITRSDWACLLLALAAIVLWRFAQEPLYATFFVIAADSLAFFPTFRKSLTKPYEETVSQYALSSLHWVFSIAALQSLTLITWLYPAWVGSFDAVLVVTLIVRRAQLGKSL